MATIHLRNQSTKKHPIYQALKPPINWQSEGLPAEPYTHVVSRARLGNRYVVVGWFHEILWSPCRKLMASQMWYLPVQTSSFLSPTVTSHPMSKTSIGTSRMETALGVLTEAASRRWGSSKRLMTRRTGRGRDGVPDNPKLWGNRVGYWLYSVGPMPPTKCVEQILVWWFGRQDSSLRTAHIQM